MTAPMVDYKIHWLKMMSVPESRAVVGRHDGINGRDRLAACAENDRKPPDDLSPWLPWSMSGERRRELMAPA